MASARIEEKERSRTDAVATDQVTKNTKTKECGDTDEGSASHLDVERVTARLDQYDADTNHASKGQRMQRHLLTKTNGLGRTLHPGRYSSSLLSPNRLRGIGMAKTLPYQLGKSTHITSPLNPLSPLQNGILSRARPRSSWRDRTNVKIGGKENEAAAVADDDDTKSRSKSDNDDKERLERIFKSKIL